MSGRKYYSEEYRRRTIKAYLSRDCTRAEFLENNSVSGSTLDKWIRKHRQSEKKVKRSDVRKSDKRTFVPLSLPKTEQPVQGQLTAVNIEIPGGTRVSFSGSFSLSDISNIVSQLKAKAL